MEYTNLYDDRAEVSVESLLFEKRALETAYRSLDKKIKNALQIAHDRVFLYHEKQLEALGSGTDWSYQDDQGNILGQLVIVLLFWNIDRVTFLLAFQVFEIWSFEVFL